MRKILLATSALAGLGLLAAPASAEMTVNVGGYTEFAMGFFDEDTTGGAARRDYDGQTEFGVNVDAMAKAENGIEYGAFISFTNESNFNNAQGAANNVNTDQAYVHVAGTFGKIILGDEQGASNLLVYAPVVGYGQVDGDYTDFTSNTSLWGIAPSFVDNEEDNTKVTYYTPSFHGFQAGVSYVPNWNDEGANVIKFQGAGTNGTTNAAYENTFEIGAQYNGTFENVNVAVSGLVTTGDAEQLPGRANAQDFTSYGFGAQVGYAGFTVGGSYVDAGDFNTIAGQNRDQTAWSIGGKYEYEAAAVAVSYLDAEGYYDFTLTAPSANTYVDDYTAIGVGATYSIFPGFVTGVDAVFFDQEAAGTARDNEGQVFTISQRVNF